jgi:hypothetical protein
MTLDDGCYSPGSKPFENAKRFVYGDSKDYNIDAVCQVIRLRADFCETVRTLDRQEYRRLLVRFGFI